MENKELLNKLRDAFRLEAEERLRSMGNELLKLEQPDTERDVESVLEVLFRDAHSLKGASRSVSLQTIEYFFQSVEEVFEMLKNKKLNFDSDIADIFQKGFDLVNDYIEDTDNIGKADKIDDIREKINEHLDNKKEASSKPQKEIKAEHRTAETISNEITSEPDTVEKNNLNSEKEITAEEPTDAVKQQPQIKDKKNIKKQSSVRISSEKLDNLMFSIEESSSVRSILNEHTKSLDTLSDEINAAIKLSKPLSDKLNYLYSVIKRLDGYDSNQEDIDERIMILKDLCDEVTQRIKYLDYQVLTHKKRSVTNNYDIHRLINENLENVRDIALQPFSSVVNVYPRMMRDVARETGKDFEFIIEGADIEIDRRILEELNYPLIHLLRNAADHGIETPYKRKGLGKPLKGTIKLSASLSTGKKVEIIVSDNGSGIDADKIRRKLVEKKNLSAEQANQISDQEVLTSIFQSGFSTSKIITSISGRGLGMSIVRDTVENIGGTIRIENRPGEGSSFIIEIPISMSSFKGVLVESDSRQYAIPITFIKHVCLIAPSDISSLNGHSTWLHNSKTIPVVSLESMLNKTKKPIEDKPLCGLILSNGGNQAVITVDKIIAQMEMTVKTLGSVLRKVRNVSGAAIIGTSQIVPVLNTRDIIKDVLESQSTININNKVSDDRKSVLVVEDSITTRMLIVNILEAAGFNVSSAVDGQQGYEMLNEGDFSLVVSDIEMPRLSGFELTKKIRKHKKFDDIPVILCTTLSKREDMEKGIDAGANAYITKGNFDQNNLLETVNRLI
ncbi:MAG: response regulator [Sedimentisphaeraceae bacterium JB056]